MKSDWHGIPGRAHRLCLLAPGSAPQPDGQSGYQQIVAKGYRQGGLPLQPPPTWQFAGSVAVAGASLVDVKGVALAYFLYPEPRQFLAGDGITVDRVEIDRDAAKRMAEADR